MDEEEAALLKRVKLAEEAVLAAEQKRLAAQEKQINAEVSAAQVDQLNRLKDATLARIAMLADRAQSNDGPMKGFWQSQLDAEMLTYTNTFNTD